MIGVTVHPVGGVMNKIESNPINASSDLPKTPILALLRLALPLGRGFVIFENYGSTTTRAGALATAPDTGNLGRQSDKSLSGTGPTLQITVSPTDRYHPRGGTAAARTSHASIATQPHSDARSGSTRHGRTRRRSFVRRGPSSFDSATPPRATP